MIPFNIAIYGNLSIYTVYLSKNTRKTGTLDAVRIHTMGPPLKRASRMNAVDNHIEKTPNNQTKYEHKWDHELRSTNHYGVLYPITLSQNELYVCVRVQSIQITQGNPVYSGTRMMSSVWTHDEITRRNTIE